MIHNVLTITLNPAVDKSCSVENIKPEKKLRCSRPLYEPGGGGINVSRGLVRLNINSTAFFTAGGRTGELLKQLLIHEGVDILPCETGAETRENFIVTDTANNEQYRFGMPGEDISAAEAQNILELIKSCTPIPEIVVISGSLPPGITTHFLKILVKELKALGAKIIADTSGEALAEVLKEGVYMVKPNLGELSKLSGHAALDNDTADEAAKQLIEKGGAEVVVVSMGPQGAYLVTSNDSFYVPAPSVKKLSTVGAGDSMVAGMVSVIARGGNYAEMVCMGVSCGTAATMNPGTGLFKPDDAIKLFNWLKKKSHNT